MTTLTEPPRGNRAMTAARLRPLDDFPRRHLGSSPEEQAAMLKGSGALDPPTRTGSDV